MQSVLEPTLLLCCQRPVGIWNIEMLPVFIEHDEQKQSRFRFQQVQQRPCEKFVACEDALLMGRGWRERLQKMGFSARAHNQSRISTCGTSLKEMAATCASSIQVS